MARAHELSLLRFADARAVEPVPFPHLVLDGALPEPLYRELANAFPDTETILRGRPITLDNAAARLPAQFVLDNPHVSELWRAFVRHHTSAAFWRELAAVFGSELRRGFPDLEVRVGRSLEAFRVLPRGGEGEADVRLDCQFTINTPGRGESSVRTPHVDRPCTIISSLFYMRRPGDEDGGDLQLYSWKQEPGFFGRRMPLPHHIELSSTVPYGTNRLVAFLNGPRSVHGVSSRQPSPWPRRYMNLIAEFPFDLWEIPAVDARELAVHQESTRDLGRRTLGGDHEQQM